MQTFYFKSYTIVYRKYIYTNIMLLYKYNVVISGTDLYRCGIELLTELQILQHSAMVKLLMEWDHTLFIGHPTRFRRWPMVKKQKQVPKGH